MTGRRSGILAFAAVLLFTVAALHAQTLLVANQADKSVSVIDTAKGAEVARIEENETRGHEVAISPDGKTAFVPIYGSTGVGKPGTDGQLMLVIDIATRKITGKIDFGHGVRPHCPKFNPKDGMLYVTTELDRAITIVDPKTLKIVGKVPTNQPESHMLAISNDGKRGYTSDVGPGTVTVLDIVARKPMTVITVSGQSQRISITPDDKLVFTSDQTKPQLAVIDTATNKLKQWIELPAFGYGTAPTPDGKWLLVALPSANKVAVVDLAALKVARTIDSVANPQEIVVRPDGATAYVSSPNEGNVGEIDLKSWKMTKKIAARPGADGMAWTK